MAGPDPAEPADAPRPAKRSKRTFSPGVAIGGALVGFDHQVFRTTPPPEELIRTGDRLPAVPSDDGGTLSVGFPEDDAPPEPR